MNNIRIMVICTGNSCRSQMAEGYIRYRNPELTVVSAGLVPSVVNPRAIEAMREIGIDISSHISKHVNAFLGQPFDYIITVCDKARQSCPVLPDNGEVVHLGVNDPVEATGTPEEIMVEFRKTRDELIRKIDAFMNERDLVPRT